MRRYIVVLVLLAILVLAMPFSYSAPPSADAGMDLTVFRHTSFWLSANMSSDPDLDNLTFTWVQVSGPTVPGTLPNQETIGLTLSVPGTYVFRVTVSDGNASDTDTVQVTVENRAPRSVITNPPTDFVTIGAQDSIIFTARFIDPDDDPLTYAWSVNGVQELFINESSHVLFFPEPGTYLVQVTASDGFTEATRSWTVEVIEDSVGPGPPPSAGIPAGIPMMLPLVIVAIIVGVVVLALFLALRGRGTQPGPSYPAMAVRPCPRCGALLSDGPFCPRCGAEIR